MSFERKSYQYPDNIKIFSLDIPLTWKKFPSCGVCLNNFSVMSGKFNRRAILLKCGHSICQKCFFVKTNTTIQCPECKQTHHIFRQPSQVCYDHYINGIVHFYEHKLAFDLAKGVNESDLPNNYGKLECSDCNAKTNHFCLQCDVPYCKTCFETVHKFGKTLRTHILTILDRQKVMIDTKTPKRCFIHKLYIDKICIDCKVTDCQMCILKEHSKHQISTIYEENKKLLPKIESSLETCREAIKYNKQAQEDIRFIEKREEEYAVEAIETISKYFQNLHGILQLKELDMMQSIKNGFSDINKQIQATKCSFEQGDECLKEIHTTLTDIKSSPPTTIYLNKIGENFLTILEGIPCSVKFSGVENNQFNFSKLKEPEENFKNLYEFTKDFSIKELTFFGHTTNENKNTEIDPNFSNDEILTTQTINNLDNKFEETKNFTSFNNIKILNIGENVNLQKVHLSHIISPINFYVQNQSYISIKADFEKQCNEEAKYSSHPDYIEINEIYLVLNNRDNCWNRAKVIDAPETDMFKVQLIDDGETLTVPKQRFREISKELLSQSPGAIQCSLYRIEIKKKFVTDAARLMVEMCNHELVHMVVVSQQTPKLVDIITNESVRDVLLFNEMVKENKKTFITDFADKIKCINEIKKNIDTPSISTFFKNNFQKGQSFKVHILNVVNPLEFYAIKSDHKSIIKDLYTKLNSDPEIKKKKIFLPKPKMTCAVLIDGKVYRATVIDVEKTMYCRVWLVDHAQYEKVTWKQLRVLSEEYYIQNEFAIQCSLSDIEPLQENNYTWTKEAISHFKLLARSSNLQIFINNIHNFCHKVTLTINNRINDRNINVLLVKYKHAISIGNESLPDDIQEEIPCNKNEIDTLEEPIQKFDIKTEENNFRTQIKIINIRTPGEFYINQKSHISAIKCFHEEIQTEQIKAINTGDIKYHKNWKINENCLILDKLKPTSDKQWFRGTIIDIDLSNDNVPTYTVFLRDHGKTVNNVLYNKLVKINDQYNNVCDGAIKCHLACVQPTGGLENWTKTSIDEFQILLDKFDSIEASIQSKKCNNSIPVILWGMVKEDNDPLAPAEFKWCNINKILVNRGIVHLTEKFETITTENVFDNDISNGQQSFDKWLAQFSQEIDNTDINDKNIDTTKDIIETNDYMDNIGLNSEQITEWLPPIPINKTIFTAYPTYVDENCIIYLHDGEQKDVFEEMRKIINKKILLLNEPNSNLYWYVGQPCLARYHLDQEYYRAVVIETKPNHIISVQFVDYGNIEDCSISELRSEILLSHIPIQAHKYKLEGIAPKDGKWSTDVLDFIHAHIVDKFCQVRISFNQENCEIKECNLSTPNYDIIDLLLTEDMVERIEISKIVTNEIEDSIDSKSDHNQNYRKIFECKEIEKLWTAGRKSESDNEFLDVEYVNERWLNDTNTITIDDSLSEDDDKISNNEMPTNSQYEILHNGFSLSYKNTLEHFSVLKLSDDINGFYCDITYFKSPIEFFIFPYIDEHKNKISELYRILESYPTKIKEIESSNINEPCLAISQNEKQWLRALTRSYSPNNDGIDIFYVDTLIHHNINKSKIKLCPYEVMDIPLKNIQVKLYGVKMNPRWRETDVKLKMNDLLNKNKIYVKIIKNNDIPEVSFYDSENGENLIYQSLIDDRFLLKSK